ncbi:NAD(P)/FAD-dependent oxidoreductase [Cypionkella sp.]|uniref:NAD(P)/FAD-dependent oxidoreductase n=1 Tax=Cypionkella sp. TaxID=2811411 RepID=UPI002FDEF204
MKILIIGAGLLGASLAFRLARAGGEVTVIEAARPASAASGRSFGWINASFYADAAHHRLRAEAMRAHHRLQREMALPAPRWQGALWWEDQGQGFDQMQADLAALGYPADPVTAEQIAALEPALAHPPARALHFVTEGATDAAALTHALLAASGARVLSGLAAKGLIQTGGRVSGVASAIGPLIADHTILAAGVATPQLLHSIGLDLPMLQRPGLILRSDPVAFRITHILVTPEQEIRQTADGSLIAPCAAHHQSDPSESIAEGAAQTTLANLSDLFGSKISLAQTLIGHRPVPGDTLPVLGQACDGLSLAVMHSGVTLAAFAAEALADQILGQGADALWQPYAPARLLRAL